jgi:hypothetical protein
MPVALPEGFEELQNKEQKQGKVALPEGFEEVSGHVPSEKSFRPADEATTISKQVDLSPPDPSSQGSMMMDMPQEPSMADTAKEGLRRGIETTAPMLPLAGIPNPLDNQRHIDPTATLRQASFKAIEVLDKMDRGLSSAIYNEWQQPEGFNPTRFFSNYINNIYSDVPLSPGSEWLRQQLLEQAAAGKISMDTYTKYSTGLPIEYAGLARDIFISPSTWALMGQKNMAVATTREGGAAALKLEAAAKDVSNFCLRHGMDYGNLFIILEAIWRAIWTKDYIRSPRIISR